MPAKNVFKKAKAVLRNADDVLYLVTGKRIKHVVGRVAEIYGQELADKAERIIAGTKEPPLDPKDPYRILGVHPGAMDIVVRGAYRALAKEYHPDTGMKPDAKKFQEATEAYDAIIKERSSKQKQSGKV